VLIPHGFDLGLSVLCVLFTLTINNFLYRESESDKNLLRPFILQISMYRFMKKEKIDFLKILDREGPLDLQTFSKLF